MKKLFLVLGVSLTIAACGGSKSGGDSTDSTGVKKDSSAVSTTALAPGAQLLAKSDCLGCHKEQEKLIGPAYADVAAKYSPATPAIIDTLANKVMKGGSGHWGTVAMSPHPALSSDDAHTMVKYILSLKKK